VGWLAWDAAGPERGSGCSDPSATYQRVKYVVPLATRRRPWRGHPFINLPQEERTRHPPYVLHHHHPAQTWASRRVRSGASPSSSGGRYTEPLSRASFAALPNHGASQASDS
jgi:hypothetical protein